MSKIPIAVQLYSVRKDCELDLPGVLEAVAKMGYDGVEFAGYHGRTAAELRKLLDDNGLKCAGTHTQLPTLLGDELQKTIEFNQVLGNEFLIVPWLGQERRATREAWLETAGLLTEASGRAHPQGMWVGYHNHDFEFKPWPGTDELLWDTFFSNTPQEVVMQVDIGNALHGGGDPIPYIARYPGRALTVHLKEHSDSNPDALVGEGDVDWPSVFDLCESVGGTRWYIVEYEKITEPGKTLEAVDGCLKNLRKLGK